MRYWLFMLYLAIVAISCDRQTETVTPIDYSYCPLDSGKYIVYEVDSILYNEYLLTVDTHSYQIKYVLGRQELDGMGNPYFRYECYQRADSAQAWNLVQVYATQRIDNQFFVIENNQRIIKLAFPIAKGVAWDGLPYIRRDTTIEIEGGSIDLYKDWGNFTCTDIDQPRTIGALHFDSTLTVLQTNTTNQIEHRKSFEYYAKGVGLIYREMWILDTQCGGNLANCAGRSWEQKAEKGFILRQRIIDYN